MAFRLQANGTVECDTPEELKSAIKAGVFSKSPAASNGAATAAPVKRRKKRRGKNLGVRAQWAAARTLAEKEGITVRAARTKLATKKKK